MPSVDLASLRSQAIDLAGRMDDPAGFRATLRNLLERHAHRLLRRGRSMEARGGLQAWDVPGLLIRELEAALRTAAQENPDRALAAARSVWPEGKLEEKLLAVFLAGFARQPEEIRAALDQWLVGMEDPSVLRALASRMTLPLAADDPALFRSRLRGWLASPAPAMRRFGWLALAAWRETGSSEAVFAAFDLLPAVFAEPDAEVIGIAAELFANLSRAVPREAGGWIAELTPKQRQQGRPFFRAAIPSLPPELAAALRATLPPAGGG